MGPGVAGSEDPLAIPARSEAGLSFQLAHFGHSEDFRTPVLPGLDHDRYPIVVRVCEVIPFTPTDSVGASRDGITSAPADRLG